MDDDSEGRSASGSTPKTIWEKIPFGSLAKTFEKVIQSSPKKDDKVKCFEKFVRKCREGFVDLHKTLDSDAADGDSLFPLIRILLPEHDRQRQAYGFKGPVLGKMLAEVLALNAQDQAKLKKFKDPGKAGAEAGDLGTILYSILLKRSADSSSSSTGSLTIAGLNNVLDRLARGAGVNQEGQKKVLLELFTSKKITPLDAKWICRILLKNLVVGVPRNAIFKLIHPQAMEMYERMMDLELVCRKLNDPSTAADIGEIKLFYYVKPMLCLRVNDLDVFGPSVTEGFGGPSPSSNPANKVKKSSGKRDMPMAPPFVIETKFDGERFQIHYQRQGEKLKYFSKKGFDFTPNYDQTLTDRFKRCIKPDVQSFIVDGEMMAWNKKYKVFTQKGEQIDVKKFTPNNPNHCAAFVAFDVLLYNGATLVNNPLRERQKTLKKMFRTEEGTLILKEATIVDTREQVERELNKAIDALEEGLVIKAIDCIYEPGKRGPTWRKVKPEFIYGTTVDDLDLLILGAYFSDSTTRGGTITHFLVGVIHKPNSGPEKFFPVAQVGSGHLRSEQMKELISNLSSKLQKKEVPSVQYKGSKKPDLFIDPKKSIVVQVKASEINSSDVYEIRYALRFPRITKVRTDKNYNEVMTVEEFHKLREDCGGKLAKRTDRNHFPNYNRRSKLTNRDVSDQDTSDEDGPSTVSVRRANTTKNYPSTSKGFYAIDDDEKGSLSKPKPKKSPIKPAIQDKKAKVVKDVFKGKVFCVYGASSWKQKMDQEIAAHGGEVTQNPLKTKTYIVGEVISFIKVKKAVETGNYDVLKAEWIKQCIESGSLIPFEPSHFFHYTKETEKLFRAQFDEFDDSYIKPISLEDARSLCKRVIQQLNGDSDSDDQDKDEEDDIDISQIKMEVDKDLFPNPAKRRKIEPYRFFQGVDVAFQGDQDPYLVSLLEFYGGRLAEEGNMTHVVVTDPLSRKPRNSAESIFVKPQWIIESTKQRRCSDDENLILV